MIPFYESVIELSSMQGITTCAVMAGIDKAKRTIEVGCGPGRHSQMLASNFVQPGGVLVSTDISGGMVKRLAQNYFNNSEFSMVKGNLFAADTETDYCNLENKCDLEDIIA